MKTPLLTRESPRVRELAGKLLTWSMAAQCNIGDTELGAAASKYGRDQLKRYGIPSLITSDECWDAAIKFLKENT